MRHGRVLAAVLCAAALMPATAAAATVEDNQVATSFDGVPIVYTLMLPDGASAENPAPAVLRTHGWAGARQRTPGGFAGDLLDAGYAVLSWDQRGFGQSGGQVEVDSPDFEAKDVSALIDVLQSDPRIAKVDGDPLIGMSGGSYAGGVQFIAAATDARIDAIAPEIAWNNLLESLIPEDVIKLGWDLILYGGGVTSITGGLNNGPAGPQFDGYNPALHQAFVEGTSTGTFSQPMKDFFAHRGPDYLLGAIDAPTFIIQATTDTLFTPKQAIDNYLTMQAQAPDTPLKMAWYCGGHGTCAPFSSGPAGYTGDRIIEWFDRYVRDQTTVDTGPRFEYLDDDGTWHGADAYPVPGTVTARGTGDGGVVVINGEPVRSGVLAGSSALTSVEVPIALSAGTVIGEPVVRLTATGVGAAEDNVLQAPLFFQLVNTATGDVLGHQVTPKVVKTDGTTNTYEFTIDAVSYTLEPGDQLALEIVPTALGYEAYRGAAVVQLEDVEVEVPVVPAAAAATG